jgi:RNA-directed DNA polymerase
LHAAWQAAARGKRSQSEVATFELALESNLFTLQDQLQSGSYRPTPYRSFHIHDPKHRLVSAAAFTDRVVHHALVQTIEPLFEPQFSYDSYANRVGKGTHKALDRAQHFMRGHRYVLQCDIKQFFPSVDHAVLLQLLARSIACPNTMALCHTILASGEGVLASEYTQVYFAGDDLLAAQRPRGLPIGNLTSQFWANVYMNALDQHIKRTLRCKAYVRYVDDFALFSDDKDQLWAWKAAIREKLKELRLTMHEASSTVYPVKNGMPFLGMQLFAEHRRLKTRNARAFEARLRDWQTLVAQGDMTLAQVQQRIQGWVAHAQQAETGRLREAILSKHTFTTPKKPKNAP